MLVAVPPLPNTLSWLGDRTNICVQAGSQLVAEVSMWPLPKTVDVLGNAWCSVVQKTGLCLLNTRKTGRGLAGLEIKRLQLFFF
jgi:hypothetical protein